MLFVDIYGALHPFHGSEDYKRVFYALYLNWLLNDLLLQDYHRFGNEVFFIFLVSFKF